MWFDTATQRKIVIVLAGFVVLAFVGLVYFQWGKGGGTGGGATFEVARINGHSIYLDEFRNLYEQIKEQYTDRISEENSQQMEKEIMNRTLRILIQKYLILQEADKAGVSVSDDETFRSIIRRKEFQTESGQFNEYLYKRLPSYYKNRLERETRENLIEQLFQIRLLDSVKISDLDLRLYYQQKYTKCKIRFILLKLPEKEKSRTDLLGLDEERIKLEKIVDKFLKIAKRTGNFIGAANSMGLKIHTTDYFTFFGPINKPGREDERWREIEVQDVYQQAFKLKPYQISDKISLPDGYTVLQLIARKNPDWNKFYYEVPQLRAELQNIHRNYLFQQWFITVINKSKIINNLDKLLGTDDKS